MVVLSLGAGPWQCQLPAPDDASIPAISEVITAPVTDTKAVAKVEAPPPKRPKRQPLETPTVQPTPRRDEVTRRETYGDKKPASRTRLTYPDEVVVRVLRLGQSSFLACWKRAQRVDPTLQITKVRLALEIDSFGVVQAARTDVEDEKLSACLAMVGRRLPFPPLGEPVVLDVPLLF
jgi:hypothetical protein